MTAVAKLGLLVPAFCICAMCFNIIIVSAVGVNRTAGTIPNRSPVALVDACIYREQNNRALHDIMSLKVEAFYTSIEHIIIFIIIFI